MSTPEHGRDLTPAEEAFGDPRNDFRLPDARLASEAARERELAVPCQEPERSGLVDGEGARPEESCWDCGGEGCETCADTGMLYVPEPQAEDALSERTRAADLQERLGVMVQASGKGYAIVDYHSLEKLASVAALPSPLVPPEWQAKDSLAIEALRDLWDELGKKEQRWISVATERKVLSALGRGATGAQPVEGQAPSCSADAPQISKFANSCRGMAFCNQANLGFCPCDTQSRDVSAATPGAGSAEGALPSPLVSSEWDAIRAAIQFTHSEGYEEVAADAESALARAEEQEASLRKGLADCQAARDDAENDANAAEEQVAVLRAALEEIAGGETARTAEEIAAAALGGASPAASSEGTE